MRQPGRWEDRGHGKFSRYESTPSQHLGKVHTDDALHSLPTITIPAMDLSKLSIRADKRSTIVKPDEIFRGLTVRGAIENLWAPQAEALALWHENRAAVDVSVEMTTGGGKTLVGLLIAQSLVNETQGKVLCVCPTKQLVEQTAHRARECSLQVATYGSQKWSDQDVFDRCIGPCITNYDAVFTSVSTFRLHEI